MKLLAVSRLTQKVAYTVAAPLYPLCGCNSGPKLGQIAEHALGSLVRAHQRCGPAQMKNEAGGDLAQIGESTEIRDERRPWSEENQLSRIATDVVSILKGDWTQKWAQFEKLADIWLS